MKRTLLVGVGFLFTVGAGDLRAQTEDEAAVRRVVAAVAALSQAKDLSGLDTLYAPDPWVRSRRSLVVGARPDTEHEYGGGA